MEILKVGQFVRRNIPEIVGAVALAGAGYILDKNLDLSYPAVSHLRETLSFWERVFYDGPEAVHLVRDHVRALEAATGFLLVKMARAAFSQPETPPIEPPKPVVISARRSGQYFNPNEYGIYPYPPAPF